MYTMVFEMLEFAVWNWTGTTEMPQNEHFELRKEKNTNNQDENTKTWT